MSANRAASRLLRMSWIVGLVAFAAAVLLGVLQAWQDAGRPPALSIDPRDHAREFAGRGDWQRVADELEAELRYQAAPAVRFGQLVRVARLRSRLGQHEQAIARYREAIEVEPARLEPRILLLADLAALGRNEELAREALAPVELAPGDARLRSGLGFALERAGDLDGAIREYERALALDGTLVQANFGLGRARLAQGHASAAIEPLERAAERRPEVAEAHAMLALAYARADRSVDAALRYRQALAIASGRPGLRGALARELIEAARRAQQARGNDAAGSSPGEVRVLNDLAWLLATQPNAEAPDASLSVQLAEESVALVPDATTLDTLGAAYAAAGRFDAARQAVARAIARARAEGDARRVEDFEARQREYAAGRAYREPRANGGAQ